MTTPGQTPPSPNTLPPNTLPPNTVPPSRPAATGPARPGPQRSGPRLTGRGSVLVMLVVFLAAGLLAAQLQAWWLAGAGYAAGCLLAARYARREALLLVVTTSPLAYLGALVVAELVTAQGGTVLATGEGTLLALAATAPWLLCGTAACVITALARGLPQCIRDLSAEGAEGKQAGVPSPAAQLEPAEPGQVTGGAR